MTQYNGLIVNPSNLQLNKFKSGIKGGIEVIFHEMLLAVLTMGLIFCIHCH